MEFLLPLLAYYFGIVLLVGYICVVLSVFSLNVGLRSRYINILSRLFNWTENERPLERSSSRDDLNEEFNEPADERCLDTLTAEILREATKAVAAIANDPFTESQRVGELPGWNLLTRTDSGIAWSSPKFTLLWVLGFMVRWMILLPIRVVITVFAMSFLLILSVPVGVLPDSGTKNFLDRLLNTIFFRLLARSGSLSVIYHHPENIPQNGSICVANHTSPFDIVVLSNHRYYSLVGQKHEGFLGTIERALQKVSQHIWFDRFQTQDRQFTRKKLQEHAQSGKPPIMVFPEGVCVNNTTILKFRKGVFEIGVPIYPVSIKYDRRFGDAFWIQDTWATHHMSLLTCWAMRADVTYLPPMSIEEGEDAMDFAMRVKRAIADAGGLKSLEWDGTLKYLPVGLQQKVASQVELATKLRQRMTM